MFRFDFDSKQFLGQVLVLFQIGRILLNSDYSSWGRIVFVVSKFELSPAQGKAV